MEINEWVVVEGRYLEAVLAIHALTGFQGNIVSTKYNQILTVGAIETQIGLNERFTGQLWLQIPQLAMLLPNNVSFTAQGVWLDDVQVLACTAPDNTDIGWLVVDDPRYDITLEAHRVLFGLYRTLFGFLQHRQGMTSELVAAIGEVNKYIDSTTELSLDARTTFNAAVESLVVLFARMNELGMIEALHALRLSTNNASEFTFAGAVMSKPLLVKELLAMMTVECIKRS